MEKLNLDSQLRNLLNKIRHQISGSGILQNSELIENPVDFKMIEKGLGKFRITNSNTELISLDFTFPSQLILFVFPLSGRINITSEIQNTEESLDDSNYGIMAFPFEDWTMSASMEANSTLGFLAISLNKIHELFELDIEDKIAPSEIAKNYRLKKFLSLRPKNAGLSITIKELFEHTLNNSYSGIYEKAKVLELLSLYMEQSNLSEKSKNACPVVHENLEEEKIRRVEKILVNNMSNPPSIPELAKMVGTNEMKLKNSFKKIYRNTIYGYLVDHRMNSARLILDKGNVQIKDVAYSVGYTNPSHFIAAFKRKFGITPKKYLLAS